MKITSKTFFNVLIHFYNVFGPYAPVGEKGSYHFTTVSMSVCQDWSVGKYVFPKISHRIFLKLLMKLGYLKGKKLREPDF